MSPVSTLTIPTNGVLWDIVTVTVKKILLMNRILPQQNYLDLEETGERKPKYYNYLAFVSNNLENEMCQSEKTL